MSRKGTNIYKRKDGRWEARYIKGFSPEGKVRYGYCYGKTYREAKEKQTQAKNALLDNINIDSVKSNHLFSHYCDEWLLINRSKIAESSFVKYHRIIENHIKPILGGYRVDKLSSIHVQQLSSNLLETKQLAPKSVRDVLTLLRTILKYAERHFNGPLPAIDIVYPKSTRREMRVLSQDEQEQLVNFLLQDMDSCRFGMLLALFTGLRIGELCALKWSDISMDTMCLRVTSTMQRLQVTDQNSSSKTRVAINTPKSPASIRTIPLPDSIAEICRHIKPSNSNAFILTGQEEKFMEPRTLQYKFSRYTAQCGLPDVNFHALRHTFATRCVEVGFEIKSLSEILGHSSPKITLERYVHSSIELKRSNMNKLNKIAI